MLLNIHVFVEDLNLSFKIYRDVALLESVYISLLLYIYIYIFLCYFITA